jgi:dihydroorotase
MVEEKNILIKGGRVIDGEKKKESVVDIFIKDGIVEKIDKNIGAAGGGTEVIDAAGLVVSPGFVDMHVHLRDPGFEDEETVESGALAAVKGGITTVACMPNTNPPIDSEHAVKYIMEKSQDVACRVLPVAAMTKGQKGRSITEMGLLSQAGAVGFSDDGKCVADARLMYEIMRYSIQFGLPLILHEEDLRMSECGLVHEGKYSTILGLEGISGLSDDLMIARDIMLAQRSGAKIHITHLSTAGGVEMIGKAKKKGIDITCDVTPHHLFFDDSVLTTFNTNFKVKPPIRSSEDREALVEGVKSGVIDAVASDHAPHLDTEKNTTFRDAEFGTIGLETLFSASFTKLCLKENMSLTDLIALITCGPAKILNIDAGKIEKGKTANITIIDTEAEKSIKREDFISKSKNSAFIGQKLSGKIVYTISKGKLVYRSM